MQLTKNFNLKEFHCKDGTHVPKIYYSNVQELADNLQILRDHINTPISITGSGYRTKSHNDSLPGAAKNSQHLTASAADINAKGYTPKQLAKIIKSLIRKGIMKQGGLGTYNTFIHYDIRGTKARW